jgi:hypothetical protein
MRRLVIYSFLLLVFQMVALAQESPATKNLPKEDIRVNKEFDENGNLIKFDSTYVYQWSSDSLFANQMIPEGFKHFFDDKFSLFNDSTFFDDSFFGDFDDLFFNPFDMQRDSVMKKKFGQDPFRSFHFKSDSIQAYPKGFDEFFGQMLPHKSDSIQPKAPKSPFSAAPRSIDDMMKMMQRHMQEMEEMQHRFFEEYQKQKKQPGLKEL